MQLTRRSAARLTSLAVLSALALAGCNHTGGPDTSLSTPAAGGQAGAAATITTPKGATLTLSQPEFYAQLQNYVPNSPPSPASPQGNYAPPGQSAGTLVMQQLLLKLMLDGLAQDQGLAPTDAEVNAQYESIKAIQEAQNVKPFEKAIADAGLAPDMIKDLQIKPQLSQIKLLTKGIPVTDADIQTYYNANKDKPIAQGGFTVPARVHIKKIALATLAEAQSLSTAIKGGQTFESQMPQSLDKLSPDGEFPQWVPIDPMPPGQAAVIKPIQATLAGQVTPPIAVTGQNGITYWLVKVVEKKDKQVLPLDQVKSLIRNQLLQQKAQSPETLRQTMRDFQTQVKISIAGPQYAALVQDLTHPAPLPPPSPLGGSPFAPAPGNKP